MGNEKLVRKSWKYMPTGTRLAFLYFILSVALDIWVIYTRLGGGVV